MLLFMVFASKNILAKPVASPDGGHTHTSRPRPGGIPIYSHDYEIDFGHQEDPLHGHRGSGGKIVTHQHHLGDGKHSHGGDLATQQHGHRGSNRKTILHDHRRGGSYHDHGGNNHRTRTRFPFRPRFPSFRPRFPSWG